LFNIHFFIHLRVALRLGVLIRSALY
jgi:hypothetical protein